MPKSSYLVKRYKVTLPKIGVQFSAQKIELQRFCKAALFTCTGHIFPSYHLCTAVCSTRGTCDTTFHAVLLAGLHRRLLTFDNRHIRSTSALSSLLPKLRSLSFTSALRTTAAQLLSALLPLALHSLSHLPTISFSTHQTRSAFHFFTQFIISPFSSPDTVHHCF